MPLKDDSTEVTYTVTVPANGGWGWVVVAASFYSMFIQNGIIFSFGSLISNIGTDMNLSRSLVALIGSLQIALYYIMCPFASAFINRFGFRICSITGSIISALSMLFAYVSSTYGELLFGYGIFNGIGLAFMNMASLLIVGFYFEKNRSLALAITSLGASLGTMFFFPMNSYLLKFGIVWRGLILLQAGLSGSIYFVSLTYRPLPTLTVMAVDENNQPARSVVTVPNLKEERKNTNETTKVERVLGAVSNTKYPTAATLFQDTTSMKTTAGGAGTSAKEVRSRISIIIKPSATSQFTPRHVEMTKSLTAQAKEDRLNEAIKLSKEDKKAPPQPQSVQKVEVILPKEVASQEKKKGKFWFACCNWEKHSNEARPMYRDDTFYEGKIENLATYQKSQKFVKDEDRTGFEYQMAVARATTTEDIEEHKGLCSTAVKRVLATMLDFTSFLKIPSFTIICVSGFLCTNGMLVPYVLVTDRNQREGLKSTAYVSVIALSTTIGRLVFGYLGDRLSPLKLYAVSMSVSGVATALSTLQFSLLYQYAYCVVFGFFVAGIVSLRCLVLLNLYGLSNLTNTTGVFFMFNGFGCVFSTPVASLIIDSLGYNVAFWYAGALLILSGILIFFIKEQNVDEMNKDHNEKQKTDKAKKNTDKVLKNVDKEKKQLK